MITRRKKVTRFRPRIRSRHPSHKILRSRFKNLPLLPFRSVIRLGSTTSTPEGIKVELNTVEAVRNSSSKLLMKQCFTENNVQTAKWWLHTAGAFTDQSTRELIQSVDLPFPIVAKSFYGSRNRGNTKINNVEELNSWMEGKNLSNYLFEVFHNYAREYRLHVSKNGCFYACRKVLKRDTPDDHKWYRNDDHCNWIREDSDNQELFDKPVNWDNIIDECVKAVKAVGLDFGAVDLRIQSSTDSDGNERSNPHFIIVEINSAPSFGQITSEKYINEIPKLLKQKYEQTISV